MHTHLPSDIFNTSSALPALVTHAIQGNYQARAAINALHNLHEMHKNRPASCSLFLDLIIQSGGVYIYTDFELIFSKRSIIKCGISFHRHHQFEIVQTRA